MNEFLSGKSARVVLVLLTVAVAAGWLLWDRSWKMDQVYTGKIVERYQWRNWLRGVKRVNKPAYHYYDYYWVVECADGETRDVEVPYHLFDDGKVGDPVKKAAGEVYPYIDTPEALQNREMKQRLLNDAVEGVKQKVFGQ